MDTEFHYYITGLLAKRSGFSEAEAATIAYASEYVDYNCQSYEVHENWGDKPYCNEISQTMDISKPRSERIRIYPLFHFVPGDPNADSARRVDGKTHPLNTTPDSANANAIIDAALGGVIADGEGLLHAIGIASHTYVDSWAHQNFVGIKDDFNQMGSDIKPNIGHADAGHYPDIPCLIWEDERLIDPLIDNRERFIEAGMALYDKYLDYNRNRGVPAEKSSDVMQDELIQILGPSSKQASMNLNRYNRNVRYQQISFLDAFDPNHLLYQATRRDGASLFWEKPKEQCGWYHFQEAVKKHGDYAFKLLKPSFIDAGIDIS